MLSVAVVSGGCGLSIFLTGRLCIKFSIAGDRAYLVLYSLWEKMIRIGVIFADSALGRKELPEFVQQTLGFSIGLVRRPRSMPGFQVLAKRWIVERTFPWLGRCRRHSKDYERNPKTSETMIDINMIRLMFRRLAPTKS